MSRMLGERHSTHVADRADARGHNRAETNQWVKAVRSRPPRVRGPLDTAGAVAEAREEFGA